MKEEKFKAIQFIREFIVRLDKELENFPKKDIEIKNRIKNEAYDLLEIAYTANVTANVDRKIELLENAIGKAKVVDFLVSLSYDENLIPSKRFIKLGEKLDDIIKYVSGWLKQIKQVKANEKNRANADASKTNT